jgi:hypothetical protein
MVTRGPPAIRCRTGIIYQATLDGQWHTVADFHAKSTDDGMMYATRSSA